MIGAENANMTKSRNNPLLYITFAVSIVLLLSLGISAQSETRSSKTWEVRNYDISVTLPTAESDRFIAIRAGLALQNVSPATASSLTLRISPNAEVSGVKIGGNAADFGKTEEKVGTGTLQRVGIRALSVASGGTLNVEVSYRLRIDENSGLAALTPLSAQLLPMSFWYPTPNSWFFPRGADFAPYRVSVSAPTGQMAASAGNLSGTTYEQTILGQPFFVTGAFDQIAAKNVSVLLTKGAGAEERRRGEELAALAADARSYFESLFGSSPTAPLRIVAVRRGSGYSDAGTTLVDESAFRRQKIDAQTAMSVAESVVHLWLGGSTRIAGEGGGVIREGLVRFLATEFIESKFGRDVADIERMRQRTAYGAVAKRDAPLTMITPLDDYYYVTNANKGAMIWRLLAKRVGSDAFYGVLKANMKTGSIDLAGFRGAFGQQKDLLDYGFDQLTDIDLLVGLPQAGEGETRAALRNTGSIDAQVDVTAITERGDRLRNNITIPARGFSEAVFRSPSRIVRVEVDSDKLFPQLDYSNDVKPLEIDESDALLFVKRPFDRQDFVTAEKNARLVLRDFPRFDDARILLARVLLSEGKTAEAEREFRAASDEKLPTARTLAWTSVGLGEIALRNGQQSAAVQFFEAAIRAGGEVGATLAARQGRSRANAPANAEASIRGFFENFDKAAVSANKAALESLLVAGDTPKAFAGGIAGQAQEWASKVTHVDIIDQSNVIVEVALNIRVINKEAESGTAVFRLSKTPGGWKLSGVESFEVR